MGEASGPSKSVMNIFRPFIHDGSVSLSSDMSDSIPIPIKILRDTGSSQSLLLSDALAFSEKSSTGASVLTTGISSEYTSVPLHTVYLTSISCQGLRIPGLYPTCVVTRAMSKKKETSDEDVTLADTSLRVSQ